MNKPTILCYSKTSSDQGNSVYILLKYLSDFKCTVLFGRSAFVSATASSRDRSQWTPTVPITAAARIIRARPSQHRGDIKTLKNRSGRVDLPNSVDDTPATWPEGDRFSLLHSPELPLHFLPSRLSHPTVKPTGARNRFGTNAALAVYRPPAAKNRSDTGLSLHSTMSLTSRES